MRIRYLSSAIVSYTRTLIAHLPFLPYERVLVCRLQCMDDKMMYDNVLSVCVYACMYFQCTRQQVGTLEPIVVAVSWTNDPREQATRETTTGLS